MFQPVPHKTQAWHKLISHGLVIFSVVAVFSLCSQIAAQQPNQPYRLPSVELNERVLWGSVCEPGNGLGLAFGGEDQEAKDGRPHTRMLREGKWVEIRSELDQANPWQETVPPLLGLDYKCARVAAQLRNDYFSGNSAAGEQESLTKIATDVRFVFRELERIEAKLSLRNDKTASNNYIAIQTALAIELVQDARWPAQKLIEKASELTPGERFAAIDVLRRRIQEACTALESEPPARALSPLCYDEKSKVYVLFGGDHLDYLMCDTWIFDPAIPQWRQMHPEHAPAPRANHQLTCDDKGRITLTGGYTYASNTDYVGGQYRDWNDGTWNYDLATNTWTGTGEKTKPTERTYRTGPFSPAYFWQGDEPNAVDFQQQLVELPANKWVKLPDLYLPEMNRDWGTAVFDPAHDLILRFSGGHSAHGGTDVLHLHLKTGRWELPNPVEFPLGQLYSNTSYPEGFNFNRRPWVTGHTYKSYAYDEASQRMLFVGEQNYTYLYDPTRGDWTGERIEKPAGMNYGGCFYDLTLCPTDHGTFCWTKEGKLFHWEKTSADSSWQWTPIALKGENLPGTVVDRSGLVFDSVRGRLLCTTKPYQGPFDGLVYAIDVKSGQVSQLPVENSAVMSEVGFLREGVNVPELDAMLLGVNFPLAEGQPRRTPLLDSSSNRWMYVELGDDDPSGREGRNVSLGMIYDSGRKLVWAVDTHSHVYVLKLDSKSLTKHELVP